MRNAIQNKLRGTRSPSLQFPTWTKSLIILSKMNMSNMALLPATLMTVIDLLFQKLTCLWESCLTSIALVGYFWPSTRSFSKSTKLPNQPEWFCRSTLLGLGIRSILASFIPQGSFRSPPICWPTAVLAPLYVELLYPLCTYESEPLSLPFIPQGSFSSPPICFRWLSAVPAPLYIFNFQCTFLRPVCWPAAADQFFVWLCHYNDFGSTFYLTIVAN